MLWGWRWQEGARPPAFRCLSSRQRQGDVTAIRFYLRSPMVGGLEWGTMVALVRDAGQGPGGRRHCHPCDTKQPRQALPCIRTPAAAPRWRRGCGQCDGSCVANGRWRGDLESSITGTLFAPPLGNTMLAHRLAMAQEERSSILGARGWRRYSCEQHRGGVWPQGETPRECEIVRMVQLRFQVPARPGAYAALAARGSCGPRSRRAHLPNRQRKAK
jgi:hypothetical protein